jgi:hypothetical protein
MEKDQSIFFKAMMTGLFVGIIDTLICLTYNIGYRNYTGYIPSALINVSSLIFCVCLLLTIVGIVYYVFLKAFKKSDPVYLIVILLLTAWLTWQSADVHRFDDVKENNGFRGLLTGIVLILGISAACLPLLYRNRKFMDSVI